MAAFHKGDRVRVKANRPFAGLEGKVISMSEEFIEVANPSRRFPILFRADELELVSREERKEP